eukprot:TRINITY_DN3703_c2_g1_i1.p1 TRINITY_DN3703_c2_g1~~TRINITY_DN3703_c2_g1_i1.p1  ORF type:complete len:1092 (+),score=312.76 TRINITY_DN3703_c2_g1_i1:106-3276(+)
MAAGSAAGGREDISPADRMQMMATQVVARFLPKDAVLAALDELRRKPELRGDIVALADMPGMDDPLRELIYSRLVHTAAGPGPGTAPAPQPGPSGAAAGPPGAAEQPAGTAWGGGQQPPQQRVFCDHPTPGAGAPPPAAIFSMGQAEPLQRRGRRSSRRSTGPGGLRPPHVRAAAAHSPPHQPAAAAEPAAAAPPAWAPPPQAEPAAQQPAHAAAGADDMAAELQMRRERYQAWRRGAAAGAAPAAAPPGAGSGSCSMAVDAEAPDTAPRQPPAGAEQAPPPPRRRIVTARRGSGSSQPARSHMQQGAARPEHPPSPQPEQREQQSPPQQQHGAEAGPPPQPEQREQQSPLQQHNGADGGEGDVECPQRSPRRTFAQYSDDSLEDWHPEDDLPSAPEPKQDTPVRHAWHLPQAAWEVPPADDVHDDQPRPQRQGRPRCAPSPKHEPLSAAPEPEKLQREGPDGGAEEEEAASQEAQQPRPQPAEDAAQQAAREAALRRQAQQRQELAVRADKAYDAQRYDEAIRLWTEAHDLETEAGSPTRKALKHVGNRAAAHVMLGDYGRAAADCRRVTAGGGASFPIWLRLARCELYIGNLEAARQAAEDARGCMPPHRDPGELSDISSIAVLARRALACGDDADSTQERCDNAYYDLQPYLDTDTAGKAPLAKLAAAQLLLRKGGARAADLARSLLASATAALLKYITTGQGEAADELDAQAAKALRLGLDAALQSSASLGDDLARLSSEGARLAEAGASRAGAVLRTVQMVRNAFSLKQSGNAEYRARSWATAKRHYSDALRQCEHGSFPGSGAGLRLTLHTNRAQAQLEMGEYSEARADTNRALELGPDNAKAVRLRGRALLGLGLLAPALRDLTKAAADTKDRAGAEHARQMVEQARVRIKDHEDDLYKLIGVPHDAPEAEIKQKVRKLVVKWHPDKHSGAGPDEHAEAERICKAVQGAADTLLDPAQRRDYDRRHFGPGGAGGAAGGGGGYGHGPGHGGTGGYAGGYRPSHGYGTGGAWRGGAGAGRSAPSGDWFCPRCGWSCAASLVFCGHCGQFKG